MTEMQVARMWLLKTQGASSREIADAVGLPLGTVKSYFSRHKEPPVSLFAKAESTCTFCGKPLPPSSGPRPKRFCDRRCYIRWWYAQDNHRRTVYNYTCKVCGKPFSVSSVKTQQYCSSACFQKARKAGAANG